MSEPKTDVAPPAGAVITVTVPSLTRLRSGIVHVSFEWSPVAPGEICCGAAGARGTVCETAISGSAHRLMQTPTMYRIHMIYTPSPVWPAVLHLRWILKAAEMPRRGGVLARTERWNSRFKIHWTQI